MGMGGALVSACDTECGIKQAAENNFGSERLWLGLMFYISISC